MGYRLYGARLREFLNFTLSSDVEALQAGGSQATRLFTPLGDIDGTLTCQSADEFALSVPGAKAGLAANWLRDLSDGFVAFDEDVQRKIPGPVMVVESESQPASQAEGDPIGAYKPYFIGAPQREGSPLPKFAWQEPESEFR